MASARHAVDECIDLTLDELADEDDDDDDECGCGHHHEDGEECGCGHHHEDGEECGCGHHHHDDDDECGCHDEDEEDEDFTAREDEYFKELVRKKTHICVSGGDDLLKKEAGRCMECSYLCNKCVDVCPNRANVAIDMRDSGLFDDPFQILHLDAYCNECGNCETFCPYDGGPYRKKFTLFSSAHDFLDSTNEGFCVEGDLVSVRNEGCVRQAHIDKDGNLEMDIDEKLLAIIGEVFISYPYLLNAVDKD